MIVLSSKNEKRRFNLAYCEIKKAERAEVQRNRHYSPHSTAWASEGEPFDDRLSDIANRYGKDSFQYIKAKSCPNSSLLRGFPSPAI